MRARVLPCPTACLCRDRTPVIFPCSYRRGEKTHSPPPPLLPLLPPLCLWPLLAAVRVGGSGELWAHLCRGVSPSPIILPPAIFHSLAASPTLTFALLLPFPTTVPSCLSFICGPYRGSLSAPALFVLLALSSPHPVQNKPNYSVNEGMPGLIPPNATLTSQIPNDPPAHRCWWKRWNWISN